MQSAMFTPAADGLFRWRATYTGDVNNAPISGPCDAPNESVSVTTTDFIFGNGFD